MMPIQALRMRKASSGGGGGGFAGVRSTAIQYVTGSPTSVPWPTGAAAGDQVWIWAADGFAFGTTPTGWTLHQINSGSNWNGAVIRKTLTSADITAGSVSVTFGGSFAGVIWAVCMNGAPTTIVTSSAFDFFRDTAGASTRVATTNSPDAIAAGDTVMLFGSGRLSNLSVTCNKGTLKNTLNASVNAGGAGYIYTALAGDVPTLSATFSFSGTPTGDFGGIVAVR